MADDHFRDGGRARNGEIGRNEVLQQPPAGEVVMFLRWLAGLIIILVCGWGLVLTVLHFTSPLGFAGVFGGLAALVSLGILWVLERDLWLSRFMGLRLSNRSAQWKETLFFWVTGVVGVFFRSTEAARSTGAQTPPAGQASSFREITETVVFVVVLVLLLKTFAAEAFVIPTGSMATTLWGYQKYVDCPKCGYHFPVNCSREVEGSGDELGNDRHIPTRGGICPNCHYPIDFTHEGIEPKCNTGDRVLVDKPLYDLHMADPNPMDVVVFKYPEAPQTDYSPMNYIKRLAGVSEHTYGIYYGKLYVGDPNQVPNWKDQEKYPDPEMEADNGRVTPGAIDAWKRRYKENMKHMMHTGEYDAANLADDLKNGKKFKIFHKPLHAVMAMRRIVYDNDHPAGDLSDAYQRWVAAGGRWSNANDHGFQHDSNDIDQVDWLSYRHVLRWSPSDAQGRPKPELITDLMGYNTENLEPPAFPGENWVGDLMLDCEVTVKQPGGELILDLAKGIDRFRARWDLSSGECTLSRAQGQSADQYRVDPDKGDYKPLGNAQTTKLHGTGTYHVRFANVDERLVVWVDSTLPFGDGVAYDAPGQRGPWRNDLQPAMIGVHKAGVGIHSLTLWRDTYYTQKPGEPDSSDLYKSETSPDLHELLSDPEQWGGLQLGRRDVLRPARPLLLPWR